MFRGVNPNVYEFPQHYGLHLDHGAAAHQVDATAAHYLMNQVADPEVNEMISEFETDEFRMFSFKIKRCPINRSHDWTMCPYAHKGEKAKRRDPCKFNYVAISCPDYRAGECPKAEFCEFAHGVFEYWLHPARYRTRPCTSGSLCKRKVCFFAHSDSQLRPETRYRFRRPYPPRAAGVGDGTVFGNEIGGGIGGDEGDHNVGGAVWASPPICRFVHPSVRAPLPSVTIGPPPMLPPPRPSERLVLGDTENHGDGKPRELRLEFLESLRRLTMGENDDGEEERNWGIMNWELPNCEWVSDHLK
ncbi:Zinc finger CCCH domain-containing protein, partial [Ancistrocladus abbreviatus]